METNENFSLISESLSSIEFEPKDLELVANEELITVLVTTARDLAVSEYESVSVILAEKLGKKVELQKVVDPSIIGGFVLRIGDKQYNASVANRLQELKREFSN